MRAGETENIFVEIMDRAKSLDPANSRKWFDDLKVVQFSGGSLLVGCPDEPAVQFMRDNCARNFTQAAQQITGHLVTVDFGIYQPGQADRKNRPPTR